MSETCEVPRELLDDVVTILESQAEYGEILVRALKRNAGVYLLIDKVRAKNVEIAVLAEKVKNLVGRTAR